MPPRQRYIWDARLGRYRDVVNGRIVAAAKVRAVIDATLRNLRGEARRLADATRAGKLSREQWALEMRDVVRSTHLFSAAAARGGWRNMDDAGYAQVDAVLREQDAFLDRFVADVLTGRQPMDGRFSQRAAMYVEAGRETHSRAQRDVEIGHGKTEERNVLRDAQHCGECPELSERGWQPIGSLPLPGQRECVTGCRCVIEYRKGEPAGVAVFASGTPFEAVTGDEPDLTGGRSPAAMAVKKLLGDFRIAAEDIDVVDKEGRTFDVGGRTFTEAGHYNPQTQKIQVNARYLGTQEQADALVSHEMTHHAWHEVRRAQEAERPGIQALYKIGSEDFERFWYPGSGYLREEMAEEFGRRFPVTRMLGKYGINDYGTTRAEATKEIGAKLRRADGVTQYSEAYWADTKVGFDTQINETLAEISALKYLPTNRTRPIATIWRRLLAEVLEIARQGG